MASPEKENICASVESGGAQEELDAGAAFVLKSKGTWLHCGYHLTASTVSPTLLSLPSVVALLGWEVGLLFLAMAAVVTFYSYALFSHILDHHAANGHRLLRFRDMTRHILGAGWARYYVGPLQILLCFAEVIVGILISGQSIKSIYLMEKPYGTMELYGFIAISGAFILLLAQMPSFHSLRHINLISLVLCLSYSGCATIASIFIGRFSSFVQRRDYSIPGDTKNKIFGAFSAISVIATAYGNCVIPEIQATIEAPVKGKMFKGLCISYSVIILAYFSVAISGYWAFGNHAQGNIFSNFIVDGGRLVPKWFLLLSNIFVILQTSTVTVAHLQPINELLEQVLSNVRKKQYSARNVIPRCISRSMMVIAATILAAMLPFFRDILGLIGAFGFLPLDFVVPAVMYVLTFKPSKRGLMFWINTSIAIIFAFVTLLGCIAAMRQIIRDANSFSLFANV